MLKLKITRMLSINVPTVVTVSNLSGLFGGFAGKSCSP